MANDDYGVRSNAYLSRARKLLDSNTPEALFHAAFELRCGIEARMREYLEAQEHISRKKREGWKIAALAGTIDAAFGMGESAARYTFHVDDVLIGTLEYRPVMRNTQVSAQRIGDFLHAQRAYREIDDPWWKETRSFFEETYGQLEWSVKGGLLGPPLRDPQGRISIHAVVDPSGPFSNLASGQKIRVQVEYFQCDST